MWSKKRLSVSYTPRKPKRATLLLKRRTPTVNRSSTSNIKVVVRVRPQNERDAALRQIIQVVDEESLIFDPKDGEDEFYVGGHKQLNRDMLKKRNKNIEFQFDHVFDEGATNLEVFEGTTQSLIESLLDGYNCSVFVYGATGAGKTYTMLGSKETPGIAYLTMVELYKQMGEVNEDYKFDLQISYLEVYNETVKDLISPSGPLNIRDDGRDGVIISGIKTHRIDSAEELFQMLERGNKNRTQHPTDANAESSRSHAVFQVHLLITHKISVESKTAKLTMIDLAGSERGGVTGGKGARFSEGSNINKSLLALGNCVDALAEGHKHIPYRNSKLTRILKDSLGGNCKTVMIVNVAPSNCAYEETFNTLNYANRAKKINNKARRNLMNVDMTACQYKKIIEDLKQKIFSLENENKTLKENTCLQKNGIVVNEAESHKTSNQSDVDNARDVLKCCYELEGKYRREIVLYQMKIKTLEWRLYQKKVVGERLQIFEYIVGDYKLSSRNEDSARKLKLQKSMFKEKVKALQKLLKEKIEMREIALQEIKEKGIMEELRCTIEVYDKKMNQESISNEVSYLKDLLLKQQNEMASSDKIINLLCKSMDYYYSVLKGFGRVSEQMESDYLNLVQKLAGIKGVSWQDEKCDYNLLRKIIDLSFASDNSSESPAMLPIIEDQEKDVAIDNALEKDDECLPAIIPELNQLFDKQTVRKFNNQLSVVKECPSPYECAVNEPDECYLQVPSTPSVGLQCIAEYLSPEEESVKNALRFSENHPLPMLPETPSTNYFNTTCDGNKSLSLNKTFMVPPTLESCDLSPGPVKIKTPEISFVMIDDEKAPSFNSTFTTESPLFNRSKPEGIDTVCSVEKVPVVGSTYSSGILQSYLISKSSETKTVDTPEKDILSVCDPSFTHRAVQVVDDHKIEEIASTDNSHRSLNSIFASISPVINKNGSVQVVDDHKIEEIASTDNSHRSLNSTFTSISPVIDKNGAVQVVDDRKIEEIASTDNSHRSLNSTFTSISPVIDKNGAVQVVDDRKIEEIASTDNSHRSLNSTFTSISPVINKNEECDEHAAAESPTAPVAELNLTFNTPVQTDNETETVENDSENSAHNSTFDSISQPSKSNTSRFEHKSTPDLNSTFTSIGIRLGGSKENVQGNANVSNSVFLSTDQVKKECKPLVISNNGRVRDCNSVSKIALSSFSAASANSSCEVQPSVKSSVLPKMKNPLLMKPVTSPSHKVRPVTATKISFSTKKNGSVSGGSSSFLLKIKSGAERNHPYSTYSRETPVYASGGLKVKPRSTVKIHFNPLTDKNKVQQFPTKGSLTKVDPDYLKKKHPSPVCGSTNMKENKIPVPSRITTPQFQPKYDIKILRQPPVPTKKTLEGPVKR